MCQLIGAEEAIKSDNFNAREAAEAEKKALREAAEKVQKANRQKTFEDVIENIRDAIRLHIEDRIEDGDQIVLPESISLTSIEVAV